MIITKQYNAPHVSHRYEHMFRSAVEDAYFKLGLFAFVDYELHTTSLPGGIVYVQYKLFNKTAQNKGGEVQKLVALNFKNNSLNAAIAQIAAETKTYQGIANINDLKKELLSIDMLPWRAMKDITLVQPNSDKQVHGSFYPIVDNGKLRVNKTTFYVSLNPVFAKNNTQLRPLYWVAAVSIASAMVARLRVEGGFFDEPIIADTATGNLRLKQVLRYPREVEINPDNLRDFVHSTILNMKEKGAFKRLLHPGHSHSAAPIYLPSPLPLFRETGILVGNKG